MTETIDIKTPEGEVVEIEIEELSSLETMRMAAKAPDGIKTNDPDEIDVTLEAVQFMVDLATSQTILTEDLLEDLETDELNRALSGIASYAFGVEDVDLSREETDYEIDDDIEFNDDGSLDLDDWR